MKLNLHYLGLFGLSLFVQANLQAQCDFSGLDESYCELDDPVTLVGDPEGGTFSGPGIVDGNTFDPEVAGPGTHTITYEMAGGGEGDKFYMKAMGGEPWGGSPNPDAMDDAFGAGGWTMESFETADPAVVFAPTTGFVFMDGSSMQASELQTFLIANLPAIEDWVNNGGRLLLNSAPNEGGDIDFGFDGTTLLYTTSPMTATHVNDVTVIDAAHPAMLGPLTPTSVTMSGTYYGHGIIDGTGYTNLLEKSGDPTKIVLAEKCWGSGRVMVGGMTTANFHSPDPHAENWRSNIMVYLYENACGGGCTVTKEVTVYAAPDVSLSADREELCEDEAVTFVATGADEYEFNIAGITNGDPFIPPTIGETTYVVIGTDTESGCVNTDTIDVLVHPLPTVTATADDYEVCFGDEVTLNGGGAETYVWDMGVTNGLPFTPGPIGFLTFNVVGTSEFGCSSEADVTIEVIDCEPVYAGFEFDDNICLGDCIVLTDTSIGTTLTTWEWDFGGATDPSTSFEQNPKICPTSVGEFEISLTITSLYGQVKTATHTLTVNELPVVTAEMDTIIDLGGEANLIATTTSPEGEYFWTPNRYVECDDCPITYASPLDSTMYNVLYIDENGCKAEDQVMVLVNFIHAVGVPTAFSPNGDGVNDVLFVKGLGIESLSFIIYNRYGEMVFETTNQNIGWDGTQMNRDVNPGVYTWVLHYDLITGDKGKQQGNTTLIR
ncbi:gliding motility-associated C-terminal domain-containing protein [Crocinitomix algicola]|uniref:gliding motility-associated C-terminal domain-containing protein n=1 Tax=Crocinitomix algicola TaxID=1740263 RepID=UPI00082AB5E4|nr:gliding motility-associated C-terminal domain-containing protein [Crocinitomix algicola]